MSIEVFFNVTILHVGKVRNFYRLLEFVFIRRLDMWLFVLQVSLAVIAGLRGWKWIPILILLGIIVFGLLIGAGFGIDAISFMAILDYASVAVFLIMAIVGKKNNPRSEMNKIEITQTDYRIKCPHCAELILPDAKVCRFCGNNLNPEIHSGSI